MLTQGKVLIKILYGSILNLQEKLISFPERIRFQDSINHCESFGGTLVMTVTKQDYIQVFVINRLLIL